MGLTGVTRGWTLCCALLSPQSLEETVVGYRDVHPNTRLTRGTGMRGARACPTEKFGGYIFHWCITDLGKHFWFCLQKKKLLWLFLACSSNSLSSSSTVLGGIAGRGATKTSPRVVDAPVPTGGTGSGKWRKSPVYHQCPLLVTWPDVTSRAVFKELHCRSGLCFCLVGLCFICSAHAHQADNDVSVILTGVNSSRNFNHLGFSCDASLRGDIMQGTARFLEGKISYSFALEIWSCVSEMKF